MHKYITCLLLATAQMFTTFSASTYRRSSILKGLPVQAHQRGKLRQKNLILKYEFVEKAPKAVMRVELSTTPQEKLICTICALLNKHFFVDGKTNQISFVLSKELITTRQERSDFIAKLKITLKAIYLSADNPKSNTVWCLFLTQPTDMKELESELENLSLIGELSDFADDTDALGNATLSSDGTHHLFDDI